MQSQNVCTKHLKNHRCANWTRSNVHIWTSRSYWPVNSRTRSKLKHFIERWYVKMLLTTICTIALCSIRFYSNESECRPARKQRCYEKLKKENEKKNIKKCWLEKFFNIVFVNWVSAFENHSAVYRLTDKCDVRAHTNMTFALTNEKNMP